MLGAAGSDAGDARHASPRQLASNHYAEEAPQNRRQRLQVPTLV